MPPLRSALVTGATGFIGSHLVRRLSEENLQVYCLVRPSTDASSLGDLPGVTIIAPGSFERSALRKALRDVRTDVVYHLAAYGVDPRQRDSEIMVKANIGLVAALLENTRLWGARFVYTGSCSEYAPTVHREPISENHPIGPISVYGAAKAAGELMGIALARSWVIPMVTLRLFGVYGTGEGPQRLIPYLIDKLQRHQRVDLTPGEQVRDFLNVQDVVDALWVAGHHGAVRPYASYNLCSGQPVSVRNIAGRTAAALSVPAELLDFGARPYRPDETMWTVGDPRRWIETTGWHPKVSLEDGIKDMIAEQQNPRHQP